MNGANLFQFSNKVTTVADNDSLVTIGCQIFGKIQRSGLYSADIHCGKDLKNLH